MKNLLDWLKMSQCEIKGQSVPFIINKLKLTPKTESLFKITKTPPVEEMKDQVLKIPCTKEELRTTVFSLPAIVCLELIIYLFISLYLKQIVMYLEMNCH